MNTLILGLIKLGNWVLSRAEQGTTQCHFSFFPKSGYMQTKPSLTFNTFIDIEQSRKRWTTVVNVANKKRKKKFVDSYFQRERTAHPFCSLPKIRQTCLDAPRSLTIDFCKFMQKILGCLIQGRKALSSLTKIFGVKNCMPCHSLLPNFASHNFFFSLHKEWLK